MKRKLLCGILLVTSLLFMVGCNSGSGQNTDVDPGVQEALDNVEKLKDEIYNSKADIVKNGTCTSEPVSYGDITFELESWDLGYSGHSLTEGDELLCIKFHITNNGSEQIVIDEYFHPAVFMNGVENSMVVVSDFYGDGTAYNVSWDSSLRGNSETDFYICVDCSVSDSYKIEVDMLDIYWEEVLGTFSFDIE